MGCREKGGERSPFCIHRGKTRLDLQTTLSEPGMRDQTCASRPWRPGAAPRSQSHLGNPQKPATPGSPSKQQNLSFPKAFRPSKARGFSLSQASSQSNASPPLPCRRFLSCAAASFSTAIFYLPSSSFLLSFSPSVTLKSLFRPYFNLCQG